MKKQQAKSGVKGSAKAKSEKAIQLEPALDKVTEVKTKFSVTEKYLNNWEYFFKFYKKYVKETGSSTISRNYPDKALYRWYRMQKHFYQQTNIDDLYPQRLDHIKKLQKAGFNFGSDRELLQLKNDENWLNVLREALKTPGEKDKMQVSHLYKFKGKGLGTWLVSIQQANKLKNPNRHKVEVKKRIQELGFDFVNVSRVPNDTAARFLNKLMNDPNPKLNQYQNLFRKTIWPKKGMISADVKKAFNLAWNYKFNTPLVWKGPKTDAERVEEWRKYRYDQDKNPTGKWYAGVKEIGNLYNWIYTKRRYKRNMDWIAHMFTDVEKSELRREGFDI